MFVILSEAKDLCNLRAVSLPRQVAQVLRFAQDDKREEDPAWSLPADEETSRASLERTAESLP